MSHKATQVSGGGNPQPPLKLGKRTIFTATLLRNVAIVVGMAAAGVALLALVYLIPTSAIENNVRRSSAIFEESGSYPSAQVQCESQMDLFTDAIMLLIAEDNTDQPIITRAMDTYYASGDPVSTLIKLAKNGQDASTARNPYLQYWHGYLVYIKPLFYFFSYGAVRKIGLVLQLLLVGVIIWRLVKARRTVLGLAFWLGYVTVSVKAVGYCLQYWSSTFIMLFACLAVVLAWEKRATSLKTLSLIFTIVGAAINYIDFLTFPLVTFVVPTLLLLALEKPHDAKRTLSVFAVCAVSWGFAYGLMWIMKWTFGTLLTGAGFFAKAIAKAGQRSLFSGEEISYIHTVSASLKRYLNNPFIFAVAAFVIFALVRLALGSLSKREKLNALFESAIPACFALAVVLLWFVAMMEHCNMHPQIVNHDFWTLGFGLAFGAATLIEETPGDNPPNPISIR